MKKIDTHCCSDNYDHNLHTSFYAFFIGALKTHGLIPKIKLHNRIP